MARVPVVVIGEPVTVKPVGTVAATDETEPLPVPAPTAVRKVEEDNVVTVLSALIWRNDIALGFVKVKRLAPTVVAPRLVRARGTVVAPVPPEDTGSALMRLSVVIVEDDMVVVAKVAVPCTAIVPVAVTLPPK